MSIGNELSYDVVEAVLSRKKDDNPAQTKELIDVLVNFHEAMQPLVRQTRERRKFVEKESMATAKNGVTTASH